MRSPASKPSPIKSTVASLRWRSIVTSGYSSRNSGSSGATALTPNVMGTASRTWPRGAADCASASLSAASPSASSRAARSDSRWPASVSARRREVRLNKRAPSRSSSRPTALETVALDSASSPAAAANDRNSTTFAKTASASKSGSFAIAAPLRLKNGNNMFQWFLFMYHEGMLIQHLNEPNLPNRKTHDRTQTICKARQRGSRLAEGQTPLLVCRLLRPQQHGPRRAARVERRRDCPEHRLSRPSPRQHGNYHLCPRGCDHPPGQSWQQGPHRGRRRPGDERGKRHPPLRIQS